MTKILYIEDEAFLAQIVTETLEKKGYDVAHELLGSKAISTFSSFKPDICILDIMLPGMNGYEIAKEIRTLNTHIPIIFLTAKQQTQDIVDGFSAGGNDYLKKPFSMEELMVRIENLLQMANGTSKANEKSKEFKIGNDYIFYPYKYLLEHPNYKRSLSLKESQILEILCQNLNDTTKRKDILLRVWNDDSYFNSRNLDVYIRKLRKHFVHDSSIEIITLKGLGYQFNG